MLLYSLRFYLFVAISAMFLMSASYICADETTQQENSQTSTQNDNHDTEKTHSYWLQQIFDELHNSNRGSASCQHLINGYYVSSDGGYANLLYEMPYDSSILSAAMLAMKSPQLKTVPENNVKQTINESISDIINGDKMKANNTLLKMKLPLNFYEKKENIQLYSSAKKPETNEKNDDPKLQTDLGVNNLTGKNMYATPAEQQSALNYILATSGLLSPVTSADLGALKGLKAVGNDNKTFLSYIVNDPTLRAYLSAIITYSAQASAGLNTLYKLYYERMPVKNTDIDLAMAYAFMKGYTGYTPDNPISPLAFQEYLATRRLKDANWYANIAQKASPADLQRQEVLLLAEIRAELFYNKLELESIKELIANQSLQTAVLSKVTIDQLAEKANQRIKNILDPNSSTSIVNQ